MEPILTVAGHEAIDRDELLVWDWRAKQLKRLGIPGYLAEGAAASHVDWHEIARLVQRGCPPLLALSIVRWRGPDRALRRPGGRARRHGHRCAAVTVCRVPGTHLSGEPEDADGR